MARTFAIVTAMMFVTITGWAQQSAAPADPDPVIVSADSVTIRRTEFDAAVKTLPSEYQQRLENASGKKQFASDLLRMKLLAAAGMNAGLDKTPSVVSQLQLMKENLVATEQLQRIEAGIVITDADLRAAYDQHKSERDQVTAVPFEAVRADLEKEVRRTKTQAVLEAIVTNAKPKFDAAYFGAAPVK